MSDDTKKTSIPGSSPAAGSTGGTTGAGSAPGTATPGTSTPGSAASGTTTPPGGMGASGTAGASTAPGTSGTGTKPAGDKSFAEEAREAKADATAEMKAAQGEAHSRAAAATSEIRDEATEMAEQARRRAEAKAMEAKDNLADRGRGMAERLRSAGHEFGDGSMPDRYVGQMADSLSNAADAFASKDLGSLIADTANFARRNPAAFVGGAALLGFAAARFLKSSSPEPDYGSSAGYSPDYGRTPAAGPDYGRTRPATGAGSYGGSDSLDRPQTGVRPAPTAAPGRPVGAPAIHSSET